MILILLWLTVYLLDIIFGHLIIIKSHMHPSKHQLENYAFLCLNLSLSRSVGLCGLTCVYHTVMHLTLHTLSAPFSTRGKKSVLSNQVPFKLQWLIGKRWEFLEPVRCQGGRWTWERPNQISHSDQSRSWFCCMIDSRAFLTPLMTLAHWSLQSPLNPTLHP